jgi:DNA-binding GntR family transcriptional regulator
MASQLGVARASVVSAYEQLLAEGYVETRHGAGTFISGEVVATPRRRSPVQHRPHADQRAHRGELAELPSLRRLEANDLGYAAPAGPDSRGS